MNAAPDLDALARRYVELWQDQLAATAADPEISDALARMIAAGGGSMQAMRVAFQNLWASAAGWPLHPGPKGPWSPDAKDPWSLYPKDPWSPDPKDPLSDAYGPKAPDSGSDVHIKGGKDGVDNTTDPSRTEPSGTTPASGPPRHGEHDVAELKTRLALLEERLAALASDRHGKGRRPRKRARRHPVS